MHYFGVPACPYCKKRVNLIRTWSLKRQGEYQCPRCGGISNIFLSPLIYVLALLAVFAGGALYFFHKFVLDDISLKTAIYVFVPFAAFFLFSLFMVYLEKPVIKKVSKEEYQKKRRIRSAVNGSAGAVPRQEEGRGYHEEDGYVSRGSYRPGPDGPSGPDRTIPEQPRHGVVNQAAFSRAKLQAAVENTQQSQRLAAPIQAPPQRRAQNAGTPPVQRPARPDAVNPVPRPQPRPQAAARQPRPAVQRPVQPAAQQQRAYGRQPVQQRPRPAAPDRGPSAGMGAQAQSNAHMQPHGDYPRRPQG